jgi:outer membrane protein TolC
LLREDALRNILGLPPSGRTELVPISPPSRAHQQFDFNGLVDLAQERRPDLIELKLIIEADEQLLLQARNQAQPALDAVMLYRWNGLEGEMPGGQDISSEPGAYTDWTLGINFSVPLGLRQSRANLRRQELLISRDWANLRQGQHRVIHQLATDIRNLDQFHDQYEAFRETRTAARLNLEAKRAQYQRGLTDFLNTLLAISDWGNAVSSEAQSLAQYNTALANLERNTGTILETHSVRFTEERFRSIGPLGRLGRGRCYPSAVRPGPNADRYESTDEPAEESFNLEDPVPRRRGRRSDILEELPAAPPLPREHSGPPVLQ